MCGVAVASPADPGFVKYALDRQVSRGPDQTAMVDLGRATVGVNRLAISGLDGGDQPLTSDDGSVLVVFNGAIYNSTELCREFRLEPRSSNDGEVIAPLYQMFGLDFADHLEGMYAICIADTERGELILAVDQVGIKPLFTCDFDDHRYVASTVAAFPERMRRHVARFPPGMVWSSAGAFERICHRTCREGPLGDLIEASVTQQRPREVKWGCSIGGVDSCVIARLAADLCPQVCTFTCGLDGSPDLVAAREVARLLGADHHEVIVDPGELPAIIDAVIEATASFETWTVTAGVVSYLTARCASAAGVRVLLTGEGADEEFGGYDEFQGIPAACLNSALRHAVHDLGGSECRRLDSAMMAWSVEARVPWLSASIIEHARRLPPASKIRCAGGERVRKWALRQYAATILPDWVAQRRKEEQPDGSGVRFELQQISDSLYSPDDVAGLRASFPLLPVTDTLSAWFVERWLAIFGTSIGTDWPEMIARGLGRQPWSQYLPGTGER